MLPKLPVVHVTSSNGAVADLTAHQTAPGAYGDVDSWRGDRDAHGHARRR